MSIVKNLSAIAVAAVLSVATLPTIASAEGLFDGFWGGEPEFGGKRSTVAFPKQYTPGQIVVSFGDRRLYNIVKPGVAVSYPIAVPREKSRWSGVTTVSSKRENPDWTPTPDMFKENPNLPPWVPGGHPMNPLGVRAMYLGGSTYRIHGTDAPWTIGQAVSKGCIRMFNEDVKELYQKVPVGTKVTVTWDRFADRIAALGSVPEIPAEPEKADKSAKKTAKVSKPEGDDGVASETAKSETAEEKHAEAKHAEVKKPAADKAPDEKKASAEKPSETKKASAETATEEKKASTETVKEEKHASAETAKEETKTSTETAKQDTKSSTETAATEKKDTSEDKAEMKPSTDETTKSAAGEQTEEKPHQKSASAE